MAVIGTNKIYCLRHTILLVSFIWNTLQNKFVTFFIWCGRIRFDLIVGDVCDGGGFGRLMYLRTTLGGTFDGGAVGEDTGEI